MAERIDATISEGAGVVRVMERRRQVMRRRWMVSSRRRRRRHGGHKRFVGAQLRLGGRQTFRYRGVEVGWTRWRRFAAGRLGRAALGTPLVVVVMVVVMVLAGRRRPPRTDRFTGGQH